MKKWKMLICLLCFIIPLVAGSKLKIKPHMPFDVEAYEANKIDYVNYYLGMSNWEQLRDYGDQIKKVAITEFNVEFPFFFEGGLKDIEPHKKFASVAYDQFVAELAAITGWEFIPYEEVMATQAYKDLHHMEADFMTGPHNFIDMSAHYKNTLIVPAHGMKITSAVRRSNYGDRQAEDFMKLNWPIEPRILGDTGADAIIKVHLQVRLEQTHSKEKGLKNKKCVVIPDHLPGVDRPQYITLAFGPTPQGFTKVVNTEIKRDKKDKDRNNIMANVAINNYGRREEYYGQKSEFFQAGFSFCLKYYTDMYGTLVNSIMGLKK